MNLPVQMSRRRRSTVFIVVVTRQRAFFGAFTRRIFVKLMQTLSNGPQREHVGEKRHDVRRRLAAFTPFMHGRGDDGQKHGHGRHKPADGVIFPNHGQVLRRMRLFVGDHLKLKGRG